LQRTIERTNMCDWKTVSEEMKQMTGNKVRAEKYLGILWLLVSIGLMFFGLWLVAMITLAISIAGFVYGKLVKNKLPFVLSGEIEDLKQRSRRDSQETGPDDYYEKYSVILKIENAFQISDQGRGTEMAEKKGIHEIVITGEMFRYFTGKKEAVLIYYPSGSLAGYLTEDGLRKIEKRPDWEKVNP
jgi:hypothetical protein